MEWLSNLINDLSYLIHDEEFMIMAVVSIFWGILLILFFLCGGDDWTPMP